MSVTISRNTDRFLSAPLEDDLVMMDLTTGDFIELNAVAAEIWNALESPSTLDALVVRLTEIFDVTPDQCSTDTLRCVEQGAATGLFTIGGTAS